MSNVKQCDRCKKLVKEDFGIGVAIRTIHIKLMNKIPYSHDYCADCTESYKEWMHADTGEENG